MVRVELGCGLVNGATADGLEDCAVRRGFTCPVMSRSAARQQPACAAQPHRPDLGQPGAREQANRAVAAVVERLDSGRTDAVSWVLQPRLIVRDTTAPAPAPKNASAT